MVIKTATFEVAPTMDPVTLSFNEFVQLPPYAVEYYIKVRNNTDSVMFLFVNVKVLQPNGITKSLLTYHNQTSNPMSDKILSYIFTPPEDGHYVAMADVRTGSPTGPILDQATGEYDFAVGVPSEPASAKADLITAEELDQTLKVVSRWTNLSPYVLPFKLTVELLDQSGLLVGTSKSLAYYVLAGQSMAIQMGFTKPVAGTYRTVAYMYVAPPNGVTGELLAQQETTIDVLALPPPAPMMGAQRLVFEGPSGTIDVGDDIAIYVDVDGTAYILDRGVIVNIL